MMRVLAVFDPIGIGQTATVLILGVLIGVVLVVGGFVLWAFVDEVRERRGEGGVRAALPGDDGVIHPLFVAADDLLGVAAQKGIGPNPAKGFRLSRRRGRHLTEHVEMPREHATLIKKVLRSLAEAGELMVALAEMWPLDSEHPVLADPEATRRFLRERIDEMSRRSAFADIHEVADYLVTALHEYSLQELVRAKKDEFRFLPENQFVLAEGEWAIGQHGPPGGVRLALAKLRPSQEYRGERPVQEMPMPAGVALAVQLDGARTTERGRRDLVPGQNRHLAVSGTASSYDEASGRLEITPIAVFSRSAGGMFRPLGRGTANSREPERGRARPARSGPVAVCRRQDRRRPQLPLARGGPRSGRPGLGASAAAWLQHSRPAPD